MGDFQNGTVSTKSENSIIRVGIHDSVPILRLFPFSRFVLRFPDFSDFCSIVSILQFFSVSFVLRLRFALQM